MTKRRVQGGEATSERRRRDGVSGKSHLRGLSPPVSATPTNALRALVHSPLLKNTLRVHESVARAMRGECVRQMATQKSAVLCSQQSHPYHACEHITRDSRADSCTHCLHARYKCRAGVYPVHALTGQSDKHYLHLIRQPTAATFSHWRRLINRISLNRVFYFALLMQ